MNDAQATTGPSAAAPPRRGARLRAAFVWGVWAVLSAGLVGYVWVVAGDFPFGDDWHLVPVYTGNQPVSLSWLWAQYNEHRLPLPKLLLVLGGAAAGHDYRAGGVLVALTLSALAGLFVLTAGRLRGGPSFADAFFPLALLHWGQSETLLIGYSLNHATSVAFAGLALAVVVGLRGAPSLRQGVTYGSCLLALPLCGSDGAALLPALAVWLACAGASRWRSGRPHGRRDGAVMLGLALAAGALLAAYLLSLEKSPGGPPRATLAQAARTALEFLASGFGPFAQTAWPFSGFVVAALGLATVLKLLRAWRVAPAERLRTLGLLCFGGAALCLAAGVGWGRGAMGPGAGFATRYMTLAAQALCLAYFVWRPGRVPVVAWGLFVAMAVLLVVSTSRGIARAEARRERMRDLRDDVARGMTPDEMATKWAPAVYGPGGEATLRERFEMLRRAGQGPYRAGR